VCVLLVFVLRSSSFVLAYSISFIDSLLIAYLRPKGKVSTLLLIDERKLTGMDGHVEVQFVPELRQDAAVQVPLVRREGEQVHLQVGQLLAHRRAPEVQVEGAHLVEDEGGVPALRPALELPVGSHGEHGGHPPPLLWGQPGHVVDDPVAHQFALKFAFDKGN